MDLQTIYLCHHSHTDLGYTHEQPIVEQLHLRYIDLALDLIERHARRGDATFRWTCEITSTVEQWVRQASDAQVERLVQAARAGQLEVCALWSNLTPLASAQRLLEMLAPVDWLRTQLGVPVRVAMNSDVNGQSWGLSDLLLDAGVQGLTMSINEHFGHAPAPFPGSFRWKAPSGRLLQVWNGPTYAHTAWLELGGDLPCALGHVQAMREKLEQTGYPHPFMYMQITHPGPQNDNMGPIAHLSDWVEAFNERSPNVRLVITTPSAFMDVMASCASEANPVLEGDWTDWWNFGAGSTPMETAAHRLSQQRLAQADALTLAGRRDDYTRLRRHAVRALDLYNEHTWGADCSVNLPLDLDTRSQQCLKLKHAWEGQALTRLLRRDGLGMLADWVSCSQTPSVLVFNPSTQAVRRTVSIPRRILEAGNVPLPLGHDAAAPAWPLDPAYQHFPDRNAWQEHELVEIGPLEIAPLGWRVVTAADQAEPSQALRLEEHSIANVELTLRAATEHCGLASVLSMQRSWTDENSTLPFGSLVAEWIQGPRSSIMAFENDDFPAQTRRSVWRTDVPIERRVARPIGDPVLSRTARCVTLEQCVELYGCAGARLVWTLFADSPELNLRVEIEKTPLGTPHSLYLALPFDLAHPQHLAEVGGAVIDPACEKIPGSSPWLSLQGGFALGDEQGSVYVTTPHTPLLQLGHFPVGHSLIGGHDVSRPGLALVWLYNNYWETNFAADDRGLYRFDFSFTFTAQAPCRDRLARMSEQAASGLLYHPFSHAPRPTRSWPAQGSLLAMQPGPVRLLDLRPVDSDERDDFDQYFMTLWNPTGRAAAFALNPGGQWEVDHAALCDSLGQSCGELVAKNGTLRVQVPARRIQLFRVGLRVSAGSAEIHSPCTHSQLQPLTNA